MWGWNQTLGTLNVFALEKDLKLVKVHLREHVVGAKWMSIKVHYRISDFKNDFQICRCAFVFQNFFLVTEPCFCSSEWRITQRAWWHGIVDQLTQGRDCVSLVWFHTQHTGAPAGHRVSALWKDVRTTKPAYHLRSLWDFGKW